MSKSIRNRNMFLLGFLKKGRASKQLGCEDPKLVKCKVCGERMGAGQVVCCKCKTMR